MQFPDLYRFPKGHPPSPYNHPVSVTDYSQAAGDVELLFQDFISDHVEPERIKRVLAGTRKGEATLPSELALLAVGWLEADGFEVGEVPGTVLDRLLANRDRVISDGTRGLHRCELCSPNQPLPHFQWRDQRYNIVGHGHYLIQYRDAVYMVPELLPHYLLEHRYRPPAEFVLAVVEGKFLQVADLVVDWVREWPIGHDAG